MKCLFFIIISMNALFFLVGCGPRPISKVVVDDVVSETTGYWYLGSNGERHWRTFTANNNKEKGNVKVNMNKEMSPFGNGVGN